jgi:hypothetical protein
MTTSAGFAFDANVCERRPRRSGGITDRELDQVERAGRLTGQVPRLEPDHRTASPSA